MNVPLTQQKFSAAPLLSLRLQEISDLFSLFIDHLCFLKFYVNHVECTFLEGLALQHNYFDIHIILCISILFLLIVEWCSIVRKYHSFLIHSPVRNHVDCLQLLVVTNETAVNIYVQVFVWTYTFIFLSKYKEVEFLVLKAGVYLGHKKLPNCVPQWLYHLCSHEQCVRVQFLYILVNTI